MWSLAARETIRDPSISKVVEKPTDTPDNHVCSLFVNRPVRTRMPGGVVRAG